MPIMTQQDFQRKAQAENEKIYPAYISHVDKNFGVNEVEIFIYNTTPREHHTPRPPNFPHLFIRACPKDQPWQLVGKLSHPYRQIEYDINNEQVVRMVDGYREVSKMLFPLNPGVDQDFDAPGTALMEGGNLNRYGVFWSTHYPPLPSELEANKARLETTYRAELERMAQAKTADEAREKANDISHAAADFFGLSFTWHQSNLKPANAGKVDCGACGELIQAKAKICIYCGAPSDPEKQKLWLSAKFGMVEHEEKRGAVRLRKDELI